MLVREFSLLVTKIFYMNFFSKISKQVLQRFFWAAQIYTLKQIFS